MATEIAALIASRICHDLISPIGAIGSGMELMALSSGQEQSSPELDPISQSVENANARIRFFRIAYGSASSTHLVGRQEVLSILKTISSGGRLTYNWNLTEDHSREITRILFLVLQCFETALPLGGDIYVNFDGTNWEIVGTGRRVTLEPLLWAAVNNSDVQHAHTSAQVQFVLLPEAIRAAGRAITITHSADTIVARF